MKLALDPQMYYSTVSVLELPDIVARTGYSWMELSPKGDFIPFFGYPRAGKRAIQIAVDFGVGVMTSEFNGRPDAPEYAEAQFLRSMDELIPVFEREGVSLVLEPHPDDFIEDGHAAVDLVRGLDREWISFLYCTPHTFHQGDDATGIIADAGEKVTYVHLADSLDHTASNGLRYIVNPPGSTVRVHQHAEMGKGEVDFDEVFHALSEIGFDGTLSSCVFGWEEVADQVNASQRERTLALVDKHFGSDVAATLNDAPRPLTETT
jgi:myo-inositol catabolism protein IolH